MSTEENERLAVVETKLDTANRTLARMEIALFDKLLPRIESLERSRSYLIGAWALTSAVLLPIAMVALKKWI